MSRRVACLYIGVGESRSIANAVRDFYSSVADHCPSKGKFALGLGPNLTRQVPNI